MSGPDDFLPGAQASEGETPSWLEDTVAEFQAFAAVDQSVSRKRHAETARRELEDLVQSVTGEQIPSGLMSSPTLMERDDRRFVRFEQWRQTLPEEQREKIWSGQRLQRRETEIGLDAYLRARETADRRTGWTSALAGGAAGAVTDPVNLGVMVATKSPSGSILRAAAYEGAVGAATEAALQPGVQRFRDDLGLESGFVQGAQNVAFAGAGGAVLGGGARALELGGKRLIKRARDRAAVDADVDAAARVYEDNLDHEAGNPYTDDYLDDYTLTLQQASEALVNEQPLPRPPQADYRPVTPQREDPLNGIIALDPDEVGVDAARFQFKAGGDDEGVTDALRGVEVWEPERANITLVWTDMAGKRWIVDGHQRRGLASRIKAADPAQKPMLLAKEYREADGWTPGALRLRAALKNIAEDTGTPIDAAKVFREAGTVPPGLKPNSPLVRDGTGLAALSDDAFGMVINEFATVRAGAAVGRVAADQPEIHAQLVEALNRLRPSSRDEAEHMARDLMAAPVIERETGSLFGDEIVADLLISERAEIRKAAVRRLAKDKAAFDTLLREETRLQAEGNVLDRQRNSARVNTDVETAVRIERQSSTKGFVSDALNDAARRLAKGEAKSDIIDGFVEAVRRGDPAGSGGRGSPGRAGADDGRADTGTDGPDPEEGLEVDQGPGLFDAPADPVPTSRKAEARRALTDIEDATEPQLAARFALAETEIREQIAADPDRLMIDPDTGETVRAEDLFNDIDAEQSAIDRLKACVIE